VSDRYWVGGTANWDATAGSKWAATSGGAGGETVPTAADDVFFTNLSTGTCTVSATANCLNLNFTGFTGTFAGSSAIGCNGNLTVSSTMTWTHSGNLNLSATCLLTSAGKTISPIILNTLSSNVTLQDALTSSGAITVSGGTFTTNNYNLTATSLSSSNSNTRTINLGSSTVTLTTDITFTTSTNLTFNAGTSSITSTANLVNINGGGQTFYNYIRTNTNAGGGLNITGSNTFNNITIAGTTSAGLRNVTISADQTINGTLTLSAGTNATCRTFVLSDTIGTTRTLTCNAVASLTDIDFRDITIAGSAAPVSGTRLGDCKGNSGITFDAPKTVYWQQASSSNWGASGSGSWAASNPGTPAQINFPLAQDTAVFPSATYPASGSTVTINRPYNIGTIDMSARTTNTMTLATGSNTPQIYGNWINGTGTTLSGTGTLTFAGRGSQTITSAGKTFTQDLNINSPSGSVTLQDAFVSNRNFNGAFTLNSGTFDSNNYNVTLSGATAGVNLDDTTVARTLNLGSGTWTIAGSGTCWDADPSTNLTVTGTGTISLTSASGKNFVGGGIQTYPTLNQGGTGTLTVSGSNKFIGLTNTAIGRIQFVNGSTNEFTSFVLNGVLGNLLPLGSINTTQAILIKPTAWSMGTLSFDGGNNTGLSFLSSDGTMEYLSVSYINGQVSAPPPSANSNFFLMFA
jgi:hypothetical protein